MENHTTKRWEERRAALLFSIAASILVYLFGLFDGSKVLLWGSFVSLMFLTMLYVKNTQFYAARDDE